jgi:cysteinyl-tRNA synthetase
VPIAVDEYGVNRWVPGAAEFMHDQMALFEQRGMNYALWEWQTSWEPFAEDVHDMTYRLGPNPDNRADVVNSDLLEVIRHYWGLNTVRPSNFASLGRLADVSRWLYLIDVDLEPETVDRIAASAHDMVVLDFIPSEENNTDYPMAEVVAEFHNASHPKLAIAYIDTGQAETYRTYWQPGWGIGNPEWIVGADPDGWEGNFPVAYWYDEWREIWLGRDGYLQAILDAGFDGVYLDWVEAYSDENVMAIADQDGVDPRQEMIWWVEDIANFTRVQRPDFIVIAQNAAELAEDDHYLEVIDAIAQEQVWFDGGADNDPPGDCPLPRTEAEVDTEAYRQSLSPPCRKQYDEYPDSTLHVSSDEYLGYLTLARDKGEIIFTVDYALQPENVTWVYETSRALGFVPFVGNRALDRYVEPVPQK